MTAEHIAKRVSLWLGGLIGVMLVVGLNAQTPAAPKPTPAPATMVAVPCELTVSEQQKTIDTLQRALDQVRVQLEVSSAAAQQMGETLVTIRKQQEAQQAKQLAAQRAAPPAAPKPVDPPKPKP